MFIKHTSSSSRTSEFMWDEQGRGRQDRDTLPYAQ